MNALVTLLVISGTLFSSACAIEEENNDKAAIATQSVSVNNAMSYNSLTFNRLVYNRLSLNRLVYNKLSGNRLVYNSLDRLGETAEGRELLSYIARCTLPEGDFLVTEHDGVEYQFAGLLALAPEWMY